MTADGLNVRRSPSTGPESKIVGGLHHGDVVTALAHQGNWLRIEYRGESAFIHEDYVAPVVAPGASEEAGATATPPTQPDGHQDSDDATAASAPPDGAQVEPTTSAHKPETAATPATTQPETADASTQQSAPEPASPQPAAPEPAATQPTDSQEPGAGEFKTLAGNVIAKTTAKEAAVLNALRADPRRLDPAWLITAQRNLGVVDATGAFNTETLRAMRDRARNPSLGAAGILDESFLSAIAPGTPFFPTELGFEEHVADATATRPADRAAQAAGYASYKEYRSSWVSITFLGKALDRGQGSGEGHPYLAERLKVAEAFLRQRHPEGGGDAGVRKAIGWNGLGNAAYDDKDDTKSSHQHTMGLAIDIDPARNPYIFNEHVGGLTHDQSMWWISTFEEMFKIATKVYGGEPISPGSLLTWSQQSSTEELIQRVTATSNAFAKYLDLSKKPKEESSRP